MIEKAIEKLKAEMTKNNNPYVQVVGQFLIDYVTENPVVAEKLLKEDKTIIKSLDEMKSAAKKKQSGGCAVLTDQEGFEIVLKYFGIDGKVKPSAPTIKLTEEPAIQKTDKSKADIDFDVSLDDFI